MCDGHGIPVKPTDVVGFYPHPWRGHESYGVVQELVQTPTSNQLRVRALDGGIHRLDADEVWWAGRTHPTGRGAIA